MRTPAAAIVVLVAFAPALHAAIARTAASNDAPVIVIVDMNTSQPGIQSTVNVPPGRTHVKVAVYLYDPLSTRKLWGIGYIGGLDRGIAFGHVPGDANHGVVEAIVPKPSLAANPGNFQELLSPPHDPGFPGPEVQYLEWGASEAALIEQRPDRPLFVADVVLRDTRPGDKFDFYLLDYVRVWSGLQRGAISTSDPFSLDTGGDVVPDATQTLYGVDPDTPVPVPPGAYAVDFVDGGTAPGPAVIRVVAPTGVEDEADVLRTTLLPARPSPFVGSTVVPFAIRERSAVRLAVYDATGRLLRVLLDSADHAPGHHRAGWDGRDAGGRALPAGVYFCRLDAGGDHHVQRVIRTH